MESALQKVTARVLNYTLKEEQLKAIECLVDKQHVLCLLPTGYGKSDVFILTPLILDEMDNSVTHMSLVISPLRSLMMDQVTLWTARGVRCAAVMADMDSAVIKDIKDGNVSVVFMSPESALQGEWRQWIRKFRKAICLLAFDEAHCIVDWGDEFRKDYGEVGVLHSVLAHVPILMCTATMTEDHRGGVLKALFLEEEDVTTVHVLPDRANIFLQLCKKVSAEEALGWYCDQIKSKGVSADKIVVYCRLVIQLMISDYGADPELGSMSLYLV